MESEEQEEVKCATKVSRTMKEFQKYEFRLQDGCQKDFETLLLKFGEKKQFSFKVFTEIWQEMDMNLIFAGLIHADDIGKFTEICMYVAMKLFMHPKNIYLQVGAFYLQYALYYRQPFKGFVRIRLTYAEYQELAKLVAIMKGESQYEFLYIYGKLRLEKAFEFVATTTPIAINYNYLNQQETTEDAFITHEEDIYTSIGGVMETTLGDLKKIQEEYSYAMKQFSDKFPELSVTMFESHIVEDLEELQRATLKVPRAEATSSGEIMSTKRRIKKRAVALENDSHRERLRKNAESIAPKPKRKRKESVKVELP